MEPESLSLDVPGLRLAALAWGPRDGRPVLCLHGWLDNAASFETLAPRLASEGYRVVALDLPGHGHSDHRAPGLAYDMLEWVVDVAAAADALGWPRFLLVGHSLGAAVAGLVAGTLPERVERLALLEGLAPNAVPAAEAPERLAKSIAGRGRRESRPPKAFPDLEAAAARLRDAVPELGLDGARRLVARGTRPVEGGLTWRVDPRLRGTSPYRITEDHIRAFLGRIACPSLVVRADRGWEFDPRVLAERAGCIRDLRVAEVPGGHHVHLDDPGTVLGHLVPFLAGLPDPGTGRDPRALEHLGYRQGELGRALRGVKLVVLDVDGAMTTGALAYGPDGDLGKEFYVRDGLGILALRRAGIGVAILSGRASRTTQARAADLGISPCLTDVQDKVEGLGRLLAQTGLTAQAVAYLGDDYVDVGVLRRVGVPAAPADAAPEALAAAKLVTRAPGGRGAVRELAEAILRAQDKWKDEVARHDPPLV